MENEQNRKNLTFIIILVVAIILVSVLIASDKFLTQKDSNNNESDSTETINNNTVVEEEQVYKNYKIGDSVTLIDSSKWHVIENTDDKDDMVILLKDDQLSSSIKPEEAENFLTTTYMKLLKDNLGALSTDIKDIRLISLDDIKTITGISEIDIDNSIEVDGDSWLYEKQTLTSDISSNNLPILICENKEETLGRICEGKDSEIWPVRPVVEIGKDYIK